MPLPENDEMFNTKGKMLQDITTLLGGRVAEEIIFGDITTGASNDIKRATATARAMVMQYGICLLYTSELKNIAEEENEIKERFYMDLEFGTAGLRGIIGAGTNRMNIYVVRRATQGLANYIAKVGKQSQGVAIAYDSRHMSPEFAQEAALCLAANGIKAYIFESLRPTPELSFAVRHLGCVAAVSYTHLDVYKRQVLCLMMSLYPHPFPT